ncbi:unnamed protein product [Echinostoma caproni]|uniref:Uncharacterized protein n=1 Tax=Echinostoma caproni TaxID=27848 RepID=A0A3P8GPG1_9TREM|nr:unnamed protein product [Echinostoma caproni]
MAPAPNSDETTSLDDLEKPEVPSLLPEYWQIPVDLEQMDPRWIEFITPCDDNSITC